VVVPTRNRLPFLTESLGSVVRQADVDWSCVVVDDASTDGTPDWLQSISDPRFAVVRSETRIERSAARNLGLNRVASPFVLFLDDDDRLAPGALARLVGALKRAPRSIASVGGRQVFDTHQRRRVAHPRFRVTKRVWAEIMLGWVPITGQVALRTDPVQAVGGFNAELNLSEDVFLWMHLAMVGEWTLIPDVVLDNRTHEGQWRPFDSIDIEHAQRRVFVEGLVGVDRAEAERLDRARVLLEAAAESYVRSDYHRSIKLYRRAFQVAPETWRSPVLGAGSVARVARSLAGAVLGDRFISFTRSARSRVQQRLRRRPGIGIEPRRYGGQ
jgi:glycosyltransferase involved in cell wall biosynthesis